MPIPIPKEPGDGFIPVPPGKAPSDWSIDLSTDRKILVYKNCSVIEDEQAELVLRLLATAVRDVLAERAEQDAQWGGPAHDDGHEPVDWAAYIEYQTYWGREQDPRRRFIKVAALAIAAIESIDRKADAERKEARQ